MHAPRGGQWIGNAGQWLPDAPRELKTQSQDEQLAIVQW
jgi:hypothetical protein